MLYVNSANGFSPISLPKEAQLSTIEDIHVTGNDIFYTGNYDGFVTELGNSMSNSGGVLHFSETGITSKKSLQLPKDFLGRKIMKLNEQEYLVLSNNGKSYILNISIGNLHTLITE